MTFDFWFALMVLIASVVGVWVILERHLVEIKRSLCANLSPYSATT